MRTATWIVICAGIAGALPAQAAPVASGVEYAYAITSSRPDDANAPRVPADLRYVFCGVAMKPQRNREEHAEVVPAHRQAIRLRHARVRGCDRPSSGG